MKHRLKFTIFLARSVNHGLFLSIFFLILILPLGLAYNPVVDDPKLEELGKSCKAITSEHRAALKEKKDFVYSEIIQTEASLVAEDVKEKRMALVDRLKDLQNQHNDLSDRIRVINAGEVVKLSNTKDKVVAFLTHQ